MTKVKGERSTQPERSSELLRVRLDADLSAPQRARRAVETLGDRLSPQAIADLHAVVTELVGISLSSAGEDPIEFRLETRGEHLRGEISRAGGMGDGISGRGHALRILGALVEEWGIAIERAAVWFECLDCER